MAAAAATSRSSENYTALHMDDFFSGLVSCGYVSVPRAVVACVFAIPPSSVSDPTPPTPLCCVFLNNIYMCVCICLKSGFFLSYFELLFQRI